MKSKIKNNISIVTNGLSPYRIDLFKKLHYSLLENTINFTVLSMTKKEPNRSWDFDSLKTEYTKLLYGFSLNIKDYYLHFNPLIIWRLWKDNIKVVIFTGSYITPTLILIILARKILNLKVYFWSESHLDEYRNYPSMILKIRTTYRTLIYNKFDGFISPGLRANNLIQTYTKENCLIHILPNTVNEEYFLAQSKKLSDKRKEIMSYLMVSPNRKNLLIVARLHKSKGLTELLELLKNSIHKNSLSIFIAGTGDLTHQLTKKAADYNLDLHLLGQLNSDEICKYLSVCDFFVLPSLSDPSPLSVVEALWSSKPLLLSKLVGNLNEALEVGVNGFSFDVQNSADISIIDSALEMPSDWYLKAQNKSLSIALNRFDSKQAVVDLTDFLIGQLRG